MADIIKKEPGGYAVSVTPKLVCMRFFSKFVFICNTCFILTVILRYVEMGNVAHGNKDAVIKLPVVQNTLVIVGYSAIFFNFIFVSLSIYLLLSRKISTIPTWIIIFNLIVFVWQVAFHFNFY